MPAEEKANKKAKSKAKAKKESDPVNDAGNSANQIEMDVIKPDFSSMTWNEWKDMHVEVSMAMSLCALMYTLMHVLACMVRHINLQRHFDCWRVCRMSTNASRHDSEYTKITDRLRVGCPFILAVVP